MQLSKRVPYYSVALCSALYFAPFLRVLSQNGDEGTLITGALRAAEGQVPFRDFFEAMGPGTFYWLALFFKLLGATWLATRICLLITTLGITVILYYLARRLRCGLETVPVIVFVAVSYHSWNAVSHHMDSNLFGLAAFAAFVYWTDHRRPPVLFLAGIAAGLTTWFMLPKGLLLCASFTLLIWVLCRKEPSFWTTLTTLLLGYLIIITAVLVLFSLAGGLPDLVYANLIWPLANYRGVNAVPYGTEFRQLYWDAFTGSLGAVCPPVAAKTISGFLSAPFVVVMGLPLVLFVLAVRKRREALNITTLPYWVAGCAFWLSEMHRRDLAHIVFGSPLLIILAFHLCRQLRSKAVGQVLQLIAIAAVVLAMLNPLVALTASHKITTRRGAVYMFDDNPVLAFLNAHVRPGESVFVYPYAPMYYFLSAARNPTRYSILMYQINTDAQFQEVLHSLDSQQVRYVVWDKSFPRWINKWFPAYRQPHCNELVVEPYLKEHYDVVGGLSAGYQFLERKGTAIVSSDLPI
jgi:hypothetical protein